MKVLVDTNVWLDILAQREPFCAFSKGAIMACINDDHSVYVVATSLKDIFYLMERALGNAKAYEAIEDVLRIATVATVDELVCCSALHHERPDYEDGIIAASAIAEKADCILSRDASAFCGLDIPRYAPAEFLALLGYEEISL